MTKPSKKNFEAIVSKIRDVIKSNQSAKQEFLTRKLNPIIREWVNYQKYNVSAAAFEKLDYEIWQCLWQWCKRRHPKKSRKWIAKKYFHTIGNRTWTFSVPTDGKMELEIEVNRLKILEQQYIGEKHNLQDKSLKEYPHNIFNRGTKINKLDKDIEMRDKNTTEELCNLEKRLR